MSKKATNVGVLFCVPPLPEQIAVLSDDDILALSGDSWPSLTAELLNELCELVKGILCPHLSAPYSESLAAMPCQAYFGYPISIPGVALQGFFLDIGDGWRLYALTTQKPAVCHTCIKLLTKIYIVERRMKRGLNNESYLSEIGQLMLGLLKPLEESRQERLSQLKQSSAAERLKTEAEAAIDNAKRLFPRRANDADFIKQKAAIELGITKRALNKRLQPFFGSVLGTATVVPKFYN